MADVIRQTGFKRLWLPVGVLGIVLAFAIVMVMRSHSALEAAQARLKQQQSVLQAEQQRVHKADDEKKIIQRYRDAYVVLQRQGFIGAEQRINWIDALRNANFALKLFGIDYSIGAQQAYTEAASVPGALQLRESHMRLGLKLLHEEDLLRFFDYLARQQVGVFHPLSCTLTRLEGVAKPSVAANVEATCEIAWITAQFPQQESIGRAETANR